LAFLSAGLHCYRWACREVRQFRITRGAMSDDYVEDFRKVCRIEVRSYLERPTNQT
jgi:hypothetical protein